MLISLNASTLSVSTNNNLVNYLHSSSSSGLVAGTFKIEGAFSAYDFNDVSSDFDWIYQSLDDGSIYQLQGIPPTADNLFGWKQAYVTPNKTQWYMIYIGDWDNDGDTKFDWILVNPNNTTQIYKLTGVSSTGQFIYSDNLNLPYTFLEVDGKKFVQFNNTSASLETWYRYTVHSNSIVKKDGKFIALVPPHSPPKAFPKNGSTLISSEDGINWKKLNVELPGIYRSIIATPVYFYAVGLPFNNRPAGSIIRSIDGHTWEEVFVSKRHLFDIAMSNDTLVAVGEHKRIVTSKDGIKWQEKVLGIEGGVLYDITYSKNDLLVSGDPKAIFSTKDMEHWSTLDTTNQAFGIRNSLFANGLFLLVADGFTLIYDGNNIKYIQRYSNYKEVVYKNRFLSFDENNVSMSSDGITWTK